MAHRACCGCHIMSYLIQNKRWGSAGMTVAAGTSIGLSDVANFFCLPLKTDLTKAPIVQKRAPSEH